MKEEIKEIFIKLGAEVCGVAHIDTFVHAPKGFHPTDIYADCKSVIVFAKALPKGIAQVSPRIIYQHFNNMSPIELDRIAYLASIEIEKSYKGFAVPIPSDGPYDHWEADKMEGRGIISMKHAAVLAGIGTLGKSTILIHSKYGTMLNIGAVLTNLNLESDALAEEMCINGCRRCIDHCPVSAINECGVDQKLCRKCAYGMNNRGFDVVNCNTCRIVCPMALGKS